MQSFRYLFVVAFFAFQLAASATEPVKIILDSDIASDCDDAGAVTMLNALADNGEAEIIAMMASTGGEWCAPALCAINTWYGRENIPIGALHEPAFWTGGNPDGPSGAFNYVSYNDYLAHHFPTRIKHRDDVPEARELYREILSEMPDSSVVINTIGPLVNLAQLLDSGPDTHSPLGGRELVRAKVKQLVVAGGRNPVGTSSNFSKAGAGVYARRVIEEWPTSIVFVGNEIGGTVLTGWEPVGDGKPSNPAQAAYRQFHGGDGLKKRPSWDQAATLYAVRGVGEFYEVVRGGFLACDSEGQTHWVTGSGGGKQHAYLRKVGDVDRELATTIESLMNQPAKRKSK
jgi:hypothetical protein